MHLHSTRRTAATGPGFVTLAGHGSLRRATGLRADPSRVRRAAWGEQAARGRWPAAGGDLSLRGALRQVGQRARSGRRAAPGSIGRLPGLTARLPTPLSRTPREELPERAPAHRRPPPRGPAERAPRPRTAGRDAAA